MSIKTIDHPLRKISFRINDSVPLTDQDETLIAMFLSLHDQEIAQSHLKKKILAEVQRVQKETEKARSVFNMIKELIAALISAADELSSVVTPKTTKRWNKIMKQTAVTNKMLEDYHAQLERLHELTADLSELNIKFIDRHEDISRWSRYQRIEMRHSDNYENNSIDIESFSEEGERFRRYISCINNHDSSVITLVNATIDKYNALSLETKMEYELWHELGKRLVLINEINDGKNFVSSISRN